MQSIKALGDPRRKRRAFTPEELWRLVNVAGERGVLYLVAAFTGLRRGELVKIEWRDVHIEEAQPYITVRSSIAKNAKLVPQPLPLKVATALRQLRRDGVEPNDFVFERLMPDMDCFRDDLRAAGISYVDEKGEYADFHSLRVTFDTDLWMAEVAPRIVMELMRHSDMRLTARTYMDANMLPSSEALEKLPSLRLAKIASHIDSQKISPGESERGRGRPAKCRRNEIVNGWRGDGRKCTVQESNLQPGDLPSVVFSVQQLRFDFHK